MNAALVAEARAWIGTRWQHQARLKGVGVDCAGLILGVLRETGAKPAERIEAAERVAAGYGRVPSGSMLQKLCEDDFRRIKLDEVDPGDVALFRFTQLPQHLAFFSDYQNGLGLIHAYAHARKVIEHRFDSVWRSRVVACYRVE